MRKVSRGLPRGAGWLWLLGLIAPAWGAAAAPGAPYRYVHHPVSTPIAAAQAAFDRGLTLLYAYQRTEAERAFRTAARLDPSLAMAWWGIALALGADINNPPEAARTQRAAEAIERAARLAVHTATPVERDYIAALTPRTSSAASPDFDALALGYRDAMRALVARYPRDPDAAALFAEAAMDLRPWRLWTANGRPQPGTEELVAVIERGLRDHPEHPGLMHMYIHAVEASSTPGRALAAARRLAALPMEPAAAHLVHMPAHTFLRVGDWQAAIRANEHSVHQALDFRVSEDPQAHQACGHCLAFLAFAYSMTGNEAGARRAAEAYRELEADPSDLISVLARFHRDEELLALPEPVDDAKRDRDIHVLRGLWHYGRGIARLDRGDASGAAAELEALSAEGRLAPPVPLFADAPDLANSYLRLGQAVDGAMLAVAGHVLGGRLALARGAAAEGLAELRAAVEVQETAQYTEPPFWPYPVRDLLAAALVKAGAPAEAEGVLREGLVRVPHDPIAVAQLRALLLASGREREAAPLGAELAAAAALADTALEPERL